MTSAVCVQKIPECRQAIARGDISREVASISIVGQSSIAGVWRRRPAAAMLCFSATLPGLSDSMHPLLQQVCDLWGAVLTGKPSSWCQLHPQHDGDRWSAQDLTEHLVLTMRNTCQLLETRLERGRPTRRRASAAQGLRRFTVLTIEWLPRGLQAPSFTCPGQIDWPPQDGAHLLQRLREECERMDCLIESCAQRFGKQRAATHFLLGPLSADEWRRFHAIHVRHHLRQLREIERAVGSSATRAPEGDL